MKDIEHFPRWIFASVAKHVEANRAGVLLYVEGQDRAKLNGVQDYIELRMDGPYMVQQTQSEFDFYAEVNMLINAHKDVKDAHKLQRLLGIALKALGVCIPIYRLGDGPKDDQSLIGSFQRREHDKNPVDVTPFGQVEPTVTNEQGTVSAQYMLCYNEG